MVFVFACNSIVWGMLIIIGLYAMLWGKWVEMKRFERVTPSKLFEREAETINVSTAPAKDDASDVSTTATTHHR